MSKNLVCHYSSYFDAAFNGGLEESETQVLHLRHCTEHIFDMVIAYMWTGTLYFPEISSDNGQQTITDVLEFIIVADYLNIADPYLIFDEPISKALGLYNMFSRRSCLTAGHIRAAYKRLGHDHYVQRLFARYCLEGYSRSLRRTAHREFHEAQIQVFRGNGRVGCLRSGSDAIVHTVKKRGQSPAVKRH